jgi:hypothetical protein
MPKRFAPGPLCRAFVLSMGVLAMPGTATAEPNHPALRALVPLQEVFAADRKTPAYDVAGLRCAGLLLAKHDWAMRHSGVAAPTDAEMAEADLMLEASEQQRLNDGMDLVRAHVSIERDARRVWRLYERQFARNDRKNGHPWQDDPLIIGDSRFCAALYRRT